MVLGVSNFGVILPKPKSFLVSVFHFEAFDPADFSIQSNLQLTVGMDLSFGTLFPSSPSLEDFLPLDRLLQTRPLHQAFPGRSEYPLDRLLQTRPFLFARDTDRSVFSCNAFLILWSSSITWHRYQE